MRKLFQGGVGLALTSLTFSFPLRALAGSNTDDLNVTTQGIKGKDTDLDINQLVGTVANVMAIVAGAIAVIFLIYSGIVYITAGGNAEQATKARQGIINSLIGIAIIVFAYAIFRFVVKSL